jgi:dTMP kinase
MFLTLEGIEGSGKSNQAKRLAMRLRESGRAVWLTREPGGTPLGERLRDLLLQQPMGELTETMLMFAARREHCEREIWPRLEQGIWVVCDRFSDATYAYQGGGHGVSSECVAALERLSIGDFRPDLTLLFDVPVEVGRERLADGRPLDKFERQQAGFFERVRTTYLARAAAEPSRFRVIDSTRPQADVRADLAALIAAL